MEKDFEFGKATRELELVKKEKQKKIFRIMKLSAAVLGIALIAIFWSDIKGTVSSGPSKNKKEKNNKSGEQGQATESPAGITIINKWDMPKSLKEISGLSYIDGDRFACVQDELGTIFIYNTKTSDIEKEISFAGVGDYEGLAMVNETAWVVRADGKLFEVDNITSGKPVVKEYSTHLTMAQNVEGLCYDKNNNRLLLAIKDNEPGNATYKGIYSFNLATRKMPSEPVFKIDLQNKVFGSGSGSKKKGSGEIMPSEIAIHPVTNEIYITDGRNPKLLILDASGAIKKLYQLNKNEFSQPEGLTFKPDGEMLIANEGVKQPGNILTVKIGE